MPSKIDQEFIDKLQNFADALESIIDILKQQSDTGDLLNKVASTMSGEKMEEITTSIKEILDISKQTNNNTKKILDEIKASRKQKETGMFGKVQDKDNKKKIVDGISVILLIAAGVLAIGLAFKIVGKVDFLSVVALSIGILVVSKAFAEITKLKLKTKEMLIAGLCLVIMSASIVISSLILLAFQPIPKEKMTSLILMSIGLGVASYFIFKAAHNIKLMDLPKYFLLPFLLPIIAYSIAKSSEYLKNTKNVGLKQGISAIFVGVILVIGALAVMLLLKVLGNVTIPKMLLAVAMIPLIAGGIVLSSVILQGFQKIENPWDMIFGSFAMGLSLLAFVPAIWLLGKMKIENMLSGALAVPIVSAAILSADWILSKGTYDVTKIPGFMWSLSVGLSLLVFGIGIFLMGKFLGMKELLLGSICVVAISGVIWLSSLILSKGEYTKFPSIDWALGVGLSILAFGINTALLGGIAILGFGLGLVAILLGMTLVPLVADVIVTTSKILSKGTYDQFPSLNWSMGVGLSLLSFGTAMALMGVIPFGETILKRGKKLVETIAQTISDVSYILAGGNYIGGPTEDWAKGIGLSINAFASALQIIENSDILDSDPESFNKFMTSLANTMKSVADTIALGNWDVKYPDEKWGKGVSAGLLPFVDAYKIISDTAPMFGEVDTSQFGTFMEGIANSMVKVSNVFSGNTWDGKYPKKEWGEGVSAGLLPFIDAYKLMSSNKSFLQGVFGGGEDTFGIFMEGIANSTVKVAKIFKGQDFSGGPTDVWSKKISTALSAFSDGLGKIDKGKVKIIEKFSDAIRDLADSLKELNKSGLEKLNNLTTS
jgi:hypothetical protein